MKHLNCRVCSSEALRPVVSLGNQRVVDFPKVPSETLVSPLVLTFCENCHLVQLSHSVDYDKLFTEFWYRSGISESMRASLQDVVSSAMKYLKAGDAVCDIGANDCTMLGMYHKTITKVGFDPSQQIDTPEAKALADYTIRNYFNTTQAKEVCQQIGKKFKVITAIAMFYDLNDPVDLIQQIKEVLDENGILIIQMNYLKSMIENTAFDNVCHEHVTYFSLTTLRWMLNKCGMEVIDVELNQVNGGSFRVYIKRMPISRDELPVGAMQRIKSLLESEKDLDKIETYHKFGLRIQQIAKELEQYIAPIVAERNTVYAYGASTRGTVLLQTMQLPLAGVAERDMNKINRFMVSRWLKIFSEEYVRSRTKHMLVLPWHFREAIIARELDWIHTGGELIFPLPEPVVVRSINGEITELKISNLLKEKQNVVMGSTAVKS